MTSINRRAIMAVDNTVNLTDASVDKGKHNTVNFTDASFDKDVLNADVPVLVDFWAEWCGPCRMMAPTVDQVATDYAGKVKVGKLDVDSNQQTAARYGIRGIPTLLLFKGGQIVEQKVGAIGKPEFQKMLDKYVSAEVKA